MTATRRRLSDHFVIEEFDCADGSLVPHGATPALVDLCRDVLEPLRRMYGPVTIISGYRSEGHNAHVGGAPNSHHLYHRHPVSPAVDLRCQRGRPAQWYATLAKSDRRGVGAYGTHAHVDQRRGRDRW